VAGPETPAFSMLPVSVPGAHRTMCVCTVFVYFALHVQLCLYFHKYFCRFAMLDKRDLTSMFRSRLMLLLSRFEGSHARFAGSIGIDRSALSQILSERSTRLPRAETLVRIAQAHQVSLDWLLGLSQDEASATEIAPLMEIEELPADAGMLANQTRLNEWHQLAAGHKIRYVPSLIPDLLRTDAVIAYEQDRGGGARTSTQIKEAEARTQYNRRPATDMEACMPLQVLQAFAAGDGVWAELPAVNRRAQPRPMAARTPAPGCATTPPGPPHRAMNCAWSAMTALMRRRTSLDVCLSGAVLFSRNTSKILTPVQAHSRRMAGSIPGTQPTSPKTERW